MSWAAHIGGIVAGAVLVFVLKRRDQPMLDREIVTPRAVKVEQQSAVRPVESRAGAALGKAVGYRQQAATAAILT